MLSGQLLFLISRFSFKFDVHGIVYSAFTKKLHQICVNLKHGGINVDRPSRNITLSKAALAIYDGWEKNEKSYNASQAIIEYEARRRGEVFTIEQKKFIEEMIKSYIKQ